MDSGGDTHCYNDEVRTECMKMNYKMTRHVTIQ